MEIEDRAVMVFVDRDLRNGVDEKKEAGDPSLEWNRGALFAKTHVYISLYKAALGSKNIEKNKAKQITVLKRPESIPYPEEEGHNWTDNLQVKGHWRESIQLCPSTSGYGMLSGPFKIAICFAWFLFNVFTA